MTLTQRPVAGLDDAQRQTAMRRWTVLRPHGQDGVLPALTAGGDGSPPSWSGS